MRLLLDSCPCPRFAHLGVDALRITLQGTHLFLDVWDQETGRSRKAGVRFSAAQYFRTAPGLEREDQVAMALVHPCGLRIRASVSKQVAVNMRSGRMQENRNGTASKCLETGMEILVNRHL